MAKKRQNKEEGFTPPVLKQETEVTPLVEQVKSFEQIAAAFVVASDDDEARGADLIHSAKVISAKVDDQRIGLTKSANEWVKSVNKIFKPMVERIDYAARQIREKCAAFHDQKQKTIELERQKAMIEFAKNAEAAAAKGEELPVLAVPAQVEKSVATGNSGLSYVKDWDFEIVDTNAITRDYLIPDEKKIRAVVKAGVRNIPGVRVFEVTRTVSRGV